MVVEMEGVSMMMRGGLVRLLGAVGAVARGKLLCRVGARTAHNGISRVLEVKSAHGGTSRALKFCVTLLGLLCPINRDY